MAIFRKEVNFSSRNLVKIHWWQNNFFCAVDIQSPINNPGRLFIFEKFSTLVALIAAWLLIFSKVLTLLVGNCIQKRFKVLGISDKSPNNVGKKQLYNGLDSIKRLNTKELGIVSCLTLGHCLLVTN